MKKDTRQFTPNEETPIIAFSFFEKPAKPVYVKKGYANNGHGKLKTTKWKHTK